MALRRLLLPCLLLASTAACAPSSTEALPRPRSAVRPLETIAGAFVSAQRALTFGDRPAHAGSLRTQKFGERSSTDTEGNVDFLVTSDSFATDLYCPMAPDRNQLCVVVTVTNLRPYLVRNAYLQITDMRPAEEGEPVSAYIGKNNDAVLPDHVEAFGEQPAALGLWWVGHLAPGASRRFQMVLNNPGKDFTFTSKLWGDDVPECKTPAADDVWAAAEADRASDRNCDGLAGDASGALFVDPVRGFDLACAANPIPDAYADDDSQGLLGCGNGSLRRPFASLTAALRARGTASKIYVAGAGTSSSAREPSSLVLDRAVDIAGGYRSEDGFATREAQPSVVRVASATAVTARAGAYRFDGLRISALPAGSPGLSSVGVQAGGGATVSLRSTELVAGPGARGVSASLSSVVPLPGGNGQPGGLAGNGRAGLGAEPSACAGTLVPMAAPGAGGAGVLGGGGFAGGDALPARGGTGGTFASPAGANGAAGATGAPGLAGQAAALPGAIVDGLFVPSRGGEGGFGQPGGPGAGGGGGTAEVLDSPATGGGGGGGGAGGCGGPGGAGGGAGGGSFGVVAFADARVTFLGSRNRVTVNRGGKGGAGADGTLGALGGTAGAGEDVSVASGGAGGAGGAGGSGGAGAGGNGGPAVCLVLADSATSTGALPACRLPVAASGGAGGASVDPSSAGASGLPGLTRSLWTAR